MNGPTFPDIEQFSIPASLLRQHAFCPRIPFFMEVKGLRPQERPWMHQGVDFHTRQHMLSKRRNFSRFGLSSATIAHNVWLKNEGMGYHGICDAIITCEEVAYPVEFKLDGNKPTEGQILQVIAYGVAIEKQFNKKVVEGFILYGEKGKTTHISITEQQRARLVTALTALRRHMTMPLMPHSDATSAKCEQCEYANFCGDRF